MVRNNMILNLKSHLFYSLHSDNERKSKINYEYVINHEHIAYMEVLSGSPSSDVCNSAVHLHVT
jgi:hypothetical protein